MRASENGKCVGRFGSGDGRRSRGKIDIVRLLFGRFNCFALLFSVFVYLERASSTRINV